MSTILEALEKANKANKGQANAASSERLAEVSARERRLREAEARHRRVVRLAIAGSVVLMILLAGSVTAIVMVIMKGDQPAEDAKTVAIPEPVSALPSTPAPKQGELQLAAVLQDSDSASNNAGPIKMPTPQPPTPTPAPTPSPTPTPTPTPTPQPTPTPEPKPRFSVNQVVTPEALGVNIEGAMIDGADSVVIIDGEMLEVGRKHKDIRLMSVQKGMLEVEYDQDGGQITLYVRY